MRRLIVGAIALAFGCATTGQEKKSQAMTAQEQAHQELQQAADAQKHAAEEQAKAEEAQRDVEKAQRALADAQAKLRGQRVKARQAQEDARRMSERAQRGAQEQQQQALSAQQQEADQARQKNQERAQTWTQEQTLEGQVVQASGDQLQVRTRDQGLVKLDVSDATAVELDGRSGSAAQIQPGSDVRASYQMIDGKAKALHLEVTSKPQDSNAQPQPSEQNEQGRATTPPR